MTTDLASGTRDAVADLILVLADTKRLLGYRYAEWMLGAPELETGIACSSMAQDEWGHARLLYALLKEFGHDVDTLEHGREPGEYRNMDVLDRPARSWPEVVVLMALVDPAVSVQLETLRSSSHTPLRQRVEKLLEEERFHEAHGGAWWRRLAGGSDASRQALTDAARPIIPRVLVWFGPDSPRAGSLRDASVVAETGPALRSRFLDRVRPLLEPIGLDVPVTGDAGETWHAEAPPAGEFDEVRRRSGGGGPDAETIRRIRGDHNRAFLMD
jgi:ring-1,2-phenylacetyl-CoA epoxidase subunit PaaC